MTKPYETLVDEGSFNERDSDVVSVDPLDYPSYPDARHTAQDRSGSSESVIAGAARIEGRDVEIATFDFGFFGGSMGEASGERLARAMERAAEGNKPFVLRTATGGARMQEGMRSLVQMPKVVAARIELARAGVPFIAVLGHPTTGGVLASLGGLADVTFASEGATIGFAGPRVAETFMGRALGENSHTAASALANGLVDEVVDQSSERSAVARVLAVMESDAPADVGAPADADVAPDDAWDAVAAARAETRLNPATALGDICDLHLELRGDRSGSDDRAVVSAIARVAGRRCIVIALDRQLSPAAGGFRKAQRVVELAGRLHLPIATLVDPRGADPSEDSESAGVAWEIARLFEAMLSTDSPIVSVVTGEGGSGGALAFATADVVIAYDHSFFSVIGPEGAAQILWRDPSRAPEAARLLKVTAHDLKRLGIADSVVAEPLDGASLRGVVAYHLDRAARAGSAEDTAAARRRRWRTL